MRAKAWLYFVAGALGFSAIAALDYMTGTDVSFVFFYLLPIAFVAWFGGRALGVAAALGGATIWFFTHGPMSDNEIAPRLVWNSLNRLGYFLVAAVLISELRLVVDGRSRLGRRELYTRLLRTDAFYDMLRDELVATVERDRPVTVGVIEMPPGFKWSSIAADKTAAEMIRVRVSGEVGRLDGAAYGILFDSVPEAEARAQLESAAEALRILGGDVAPQTRSMTFLAPPRTLETMIRPTARAG